MRFTLGGVKRAAAIFAAAVAAPALVASPASAQNNANMIGVWDIGAPAAHDTGTAQAVVQHEYVATSDGYVTDLGAAFTCTDGTCDPVVLLVLRQLSTLDDWEVVKKSEPVLPDGTKQTERLALPSKVRVQAGDVIGVQLGANTRIKWGDGPQGMASLSATPFTTPTKTFEDRKLALDVMYNATFERLPTAAGTFTSNTLERVLAGSAVTYEVALNAPDAPNSAPAITGTVAFEADGTPIPGCESVAVVASKATCNATARANFGYREITADYSGDANYSTTKPARFDQWAIEPAKMFAKAKPNAVEPAANIAYHAEIANVYLDSVDSGSTGPAGGFDTGTAAYFVDGQPVAGCGEQPVDQDGLTKCLATAPLVAGTHTLKVVYSGDHDRATNFAEATFDVIAPAATADPSADFGTVAVGATETRTITLTSTGKVDLKFEVARLKGDPAFGFGGTTCGDPLAHGKTCELTVTFKPTAGGAQTATLDIAHNGGHTTVVLSGTGLAPKVETPVPPAPTATPTPTPTPKPGATIDPEKKPTFTVSVPKSDGASAAQAPTLKLPLSCPPNSECQLSGQLTIEESALKGKKAKASAAATTTVAKFSKVQVEAGGLKTVKLKLSPAFVKSAQKRGIRRIRATLTINTVLGSGEKITTSQRITIVLPKAAKKQVARKQQVRPAFTG